MLAPTESNSIHCMFFASAYSRLPLSNSAVAPISYYEHSYFASARGTLLWFKQGEARFSSEKLEGCDGGATAFEESNSAQFIRLSRELYGLRCKRQAKHLPQSTVITPPSNLGLFSCEARKNTYVDLSVLARVNMRRCFFINPNCLDITY